MIEKKQVKFFCTYEEYEQIKQNANKSGKATVSAYLRDVAINKAVLNINYDAILEHTKLINTLKRELHLIITMLVQTRQAYPLDIQRMISLLEEISENQKKMLRQTRRERQNIRKDIKKILSGKNTEDKSDL